MTRAERLADLDRRADLMARFGYYASALELRLRADRLRGYV